MIFTLSDIEQLARIPRLTLINAISGFKSANLVGTSSASKVPNLAIFSSAIHLGSDPPLIGIVTRPVDGELKTTRHTYQNIRESGFFTLNHIHTGIIEAAHQTSAAYPDEVSEFEQVGLTPFWSKRLPNAPYVAEARIRLGLEYLEEYCIAANNTILIVGKVLELYLPDTCVDARGNVDLNLAETVAISGIDTYHQGLQLKRMEYARVQSGDNT